MKKAFEAGREGGEERGGKGKLEIRFQTVSNATVATLEFSSTSLEDHIIEVDPTVFNGVKNIFFVFTEASNVKFDSWQFDETAPSGIKGITTETLKSGAIYDLSGARLKGKPSRKIYIENGKKHIAQ